MQPTNSQQALSQLQTAQSQSQDPNTILSGQKQQLGVNAAQNTVTGLRGAIDNTTRLLNQVAPSVMGRTGQSLVTNAQATRQIGNEQAPISQTLGDQSNKYNQANTDLGNLENQAQTATSGIYAGQQNKISYLQNLYNSLYGQEQDASKQAEASRQFNADLAEKQREANMSGSSSSGVGDLISQLLGGSGSSSGASGHQMQQRTGGGFNFQDANGNATNAVAFSQAKGGQLPIRTLLQQMATAGDSGAKTALNYVGNDYGVNHAKLNQLKIGPVGGPDTYNATVSLLHSLGFRV